mmetsp:Transcript_51211/g.128628  ORF Transcript_51211/g.128628 Transcript_51211/m.128628 type:complete len:256 (+) Transcript_51211:758-1525(+)
MSVCAQVHDRLALAEHVGGGLLAGPGLEEPAAEGEGGPYKRPAQVDIERDVAGVRVHIEVSVVVFFIVYDGCVVSVERGAAVAGEEQGRQRPPPLQQVVHPLLQPDVVEHKPILVHRVGSALWERLLGQRIVFLDHLDECVTQAAREHLESKDPSSDLSDRKRPRRCWRVTRLPHVHLRRALKKRPIAVRQPLDRPRSEDLRLLRDPAVLLADPRPLLMHAAVVLVLQAHAAIDVVPQPCEVAGLVLFGQRVEML